jgi:23S rRNA (adenine2503-C2)-methyltransferase
LPVAAKFELLGLDNQELTGIVSKFAQPPYRARQLHEAIYVHRVTELADVTTLPQDLRQKLAEAGYTTGLH